MTGLKPRFSALVVFFSIGMLSSARAEVRVVDAAGGGEYTDLFVAVAVANPGDLLLVRPGDYRGLFQFLTLSEGISILSDGTGVVEVGPVRVNNLPANQEVYLRGLTMHLDLLSSGLPGLIVHHCNGTVWVEDCSMLGGDGSNSIGVNPGESSCTVTTSSDVLFLRCSFDAGDGSFSNDPYALGGGDGGDAIEVNSADLHLWDCTVLAGHGGAADGDVTPTPAGAGGHAIAGSNADVFVSGSELTGGNAGDGDVDLPDPGNDGGDAIRLTGTSSARVLDSLLAPGAGGTNGVFAAGNPGQAANVSGTVQMLPDPYRSFSIDGPAMEGSSIAVSYEGVSGDLFTLFVSLAPFSSPLALGQGSWIPAPPYLALVTLGPVGPSGSYQQSFPVPDAGLGPEDSFHLLIQTFVLSAASELTISSPSSTYLLDQL